MIPDWLFEYMIFPLVVFATGLVYLILEAWLQLSVLALIVVFIYLAVRVKNSGAPILAAVGLGILLSLSGCQPLMEGEGFALIARTLTPETATSGDWLR